ncbi:hypothetical protein EAG_01217 [Camponotus floridanus]|uniref:Uncharacterized protein n=1 Tax=Camponotus floridanus TaxID=104421 RepID=E2AD52_CAMFO|nr:hypothetical protein EAG_01217 [Camponotus floridanus]
MNVLLIYDAKFLPAPFSKTEGSSRSGLRNANLQEGWEDFKVDSVIILKLREINSRDDIINRAIEEFNFSIFLGQNSNTTEKVKENSIMTCLRAYQGIKMENATRLSDLYSMYAEKR